MTHEERLAVAEARVADLRGEVSMLREDFNRKVEHIQHEMTDGFDKISKKLDTLTAKLEQGKGAWWAVTKIAAIITFVLTVILAVLKSGMISP